MKDDIQRRETLADFLRTRRARLSPAEAGFPAGRRRRLPGLRREEVAQLANIGVSWYTSLEQGRDISPSLDVLHSLADALQLSPEERQHLLLLANQQPAAIFPQIETVSPVLLRVLEDLNPDPAYIMNRRWDYVAWNKAAKCVFFPENIASPPYERNLVWRIFANPANQEGFVEWEEKAQAILAEFRAETARYADEDWHKQLVADLQRISPQFRDWWPRHDVRGRNDGPKDIEHPTAGRLQFEFTTLQVPANPDFKVMIYMPLSGTDTAAKIQRLLDIEQANNQRLVESIVR